MRSATSYFNGTLYRKTLARFWPLWAGYGVIWMFCMPLSMLNLYFNRYMNSAPATRLFNQALDLPAYATAGLYLAAFFAILCAMAVFSYLYNSRSACWFHALPMRREALFTTLYLAGLSFLLLPQLVTAVLTAIIEMAFLPIQQWGAALGALLVWLLAQSGICLFFFSFASFCAMFTGHVLALPAFYCILNVLADVVYTLIDNLFQSFFFGYAGSSGAQTVARYLTPGIALKDAVTVFGRGDFGGYYFRFPHTIAAYAVVGVLLTAASLEVYRRRHAETAGDVVSIPLVRPLFRYGVSFCAGLCLGMFTSAFFGWNSVSALIPCVLVWTVIGYFVAEMLLRKSFRVLKAWKGGAVMTAVMLVACLGCTMDLFGVEARVPRLDQVAELTVRMNMGYPNDSGDYLTVTLTDPEDIQKFLSLHQVIVDNRERLDSSTKYFSAGYDYTSVCLQYNLKGGSSLKRNYSSLPINWEELEDTGSLTSLCQQIYTDRELVARAYDFEGFLRNGRLTGAWLGYLNDPDGNRAYEEVYVDGYAKELWDAVQQDFAEGNIGVRYLFDDDPERRANTYHTDLHFEAIRNSSEVYGPADDAEVYYDTRAYTNSLTVTLTPQARHTLAVLEKTSVFEDGYSLAERELDYAPRYPDTVIY